MKKRMVLIMIVILLAIPAAVFAGDGLSFGPTAMALDGFTLGDIIDYPEEVAESISSENLYYGGEVRLDLSIFQVSTNAFYSNELIEGFVNAGVYLDLGIIGLGVSGGATYVTDFSDIEFGEYYSAKANVDLILGSMILSGFVIGYTDEPDLVETPDDLVGVVGASVLIQL